MSKSPISSQRRGSPVQDKRLHDLYIEIQNAIQEIDEDDFMSVPQLVVAGAQSSGKTTYIESLVGFRVGITAKGTGTRCPVRYVLRSGEESFYSVCINQQDKIVINGDVGDLLKQRELLREEVEKKMEKHCGNGFQEKPIIVEITDPSVVDIDIVDLPGLKAVGDHGSDQISAMVSKYMMDKNVIPIVVSMAGKTEENSLDMDVLQQHKLDLSRALLVINGVNKQLKECFRVSDVNTFMNGFKHKFKSCRDVKFVMLHYDITGVGIDKDNMSQEQVEEYYSTLPEKEKESFEAHLTGMKQDADLSNDLWRSFGLEHTYAAMKDILLDWTRKHGVEAVTRIQQKARDMKHSRETMKRQISVREVRESELRLIMKQYGSNWLATMKSIRGGDLLRASNASPGQFNKQHIFMSDDIGMLTYDGEITEFDDCNDNARWMSVERLDETLVDTYTGRSLKKPMSCNAAIARLLRVAGVVVMSHPMTEATDAQIENMSFDRGANAMTRSVNLTSIVKRIVDRELSRLFPDVFDRVLHHIRELCMVPMNHSHTLLCDFTYHEMKKCQKIQAKLDEEFLDWLDVSLKQCSQALQVMLLEKLATLNVDIDNRLINLLAMAPCRDVEIIDAEEELQQAAASCSIGPSMSSSPGNGSMTKHQRHARDSMQKVRAILQKMDIQPVDFVEAGEAHIPNFEYRRIDVNEVNAFAEKYFHFYKGIIQMEMEAKVELFISSALEHPNGGHDDLHQRIGKICEYAFEDPDLKAAIVKDLDTAELKLQRASTLTKINSLNDITEKLKMNLGLSRV